MGSQGVILLLLIAIAVGLGLYSIFGISLPVQAQYNKLYASHVTMAKDQATFQGIRDQIIIIWNQMNESFKDKDFTTTYNTPWYWDQNYDNSLSAQQDYFKQLIIRIDLYQNTYDSQMKNNTNPIYLTDWYDKSIQNLRVEMEREGDLDWAIHDAWYLNYHPEAYWLGWWVVMIELILVATIIIAAS